MLGSRFAGSKNSLNAIRLLLASAVILSHSWWLGGYGPEPSPGSVKLGSWAVLGFFGISGYLITRSRTRASSAGSYCLARFLRIFPGLAACVTAVAFVVAPVTAALTGRHYSLSGAAVYFVTNLSAGTPFIAVGGIPGSLEGLPDPRLWNGPLWTLFWEIACYILIGIVFRLFRPDLVRLALLTLFSVASAAAVAVDAGWIAAPVRNDWPLIPVLSFLAGALIYLFQDVIPANPTTLVLAAGLVVLVSSFGFASSLVHLPLSLFLILGSLYLPLFGVGSRYDVSFGIYIYGWPAQQFLAALGLHSVVPPLVFAAASLLLVAPVAWLSCRYVEKPAQLWHRAQGVRRTVRELA